MCARSRKCVYHPPVPHPERLCGYRRRICRTGAPTSANRVPHVDPGFDTGHVFKARLNVPDARNTKAQRVRFYDRLLGKSAAAAYPVPLASGNIGISLPIEKAPYRAGRRAE
jgi:hypothetical protein